jgi:hypothetical protein
MFFLQEKIMSHNNRLNEKNNYFFIQTYKNQSHFVGLLIFKSIFYSSLPNKPPDTLLFLCQKVHLCAFNTNLHR